MLAHCRKMFPCYTMMEEGGRGGDLSELSTHCHMNRRVYINKFSDSIAGGTGCFLQHTLMRINARQITMLLQHGEDTD